MLANLKQKLYYKQAIAPQTVTADVTSAAIDTKDINNLGFVVAVGAFSFTTGNKIALTLQESDDDSTYTDVEDVYEGTAPSPIVLDAAGDSAVAQVLEYRGNKQYVKLIAAVSGTVSVTLSAVAISTRPELMPPQ